MLRGKILVSYRDRGRGHSFVSNQWETVGPRGDRTTEAEPNGTFMFEGEMSILKICFQMHLESITESLHPVTSHLKKRMYFLWQ